MADFDNMAHRKSLQAVLAGASGSLLLKEAVQQVAKATDFVRNEFCGVAVANAVLASRNNHYAVESNAMTQDVANVTEASQNVFQRALALARSDKPDNFRLQMEDLDSLIHEAMDIISRVNLDDTESGEAD